MSNLFFKWSAPLRWLREEFVVDNTFLNAPKPDIVYEQNDTHYDDENYEDLPF